jgi:hypothetical protein
MPGFITRGVLVGDVRITVRYADGRQREIEGVRKVYSVAPNIAMGFAGNIDAGFRMVSDFAVFIGNSVPPGHMTYEPSRAIFCWLRRARYHWATTLTKHQTEGGCELIFMAALPTNGPLASTAGYIARAPGFEPHPIEAGTAVSIGLGSQIPEYAAALVALAVDPELMQFETMYWDHVGGAGMAVSAAISDAIDERAVPGISPHLHICSVRFGQIEIGTNDRIALTPGVASRVMPAVVEGWEEWSGWKKAQRLADGVVAMA